MTLVKAPIKLHGDRNSVDGMALVDTGSSMTVLDREVADKIGVKYTGRERTLVTASGHKLEGEIAVVNKLTIEGEVLDYAHTLVTQVPNEVKDVLSRNELADWIIVGVTTLELVGYAADTTTGKLRKVEALFL